MATAIPIRGRGPTSFDVICAGEPRWRAAKTPRGSSARALRAGLLDIARLLSTAQVRVGLATVLEDDRFARASLAEIAALGTDVGGVKLAPRVADFVVADASAGESFAFSEGGLTQDLEIPAPWSSQVLLLSGLSAVVSGLA